MIKRFLCLTVAFFVFVAFFLPLRAVEAVLVPDLGNLPDPKLECPPIQNTPSFTIVYGTALLNQLDAPIGSLVKTLSPRGDLVGCFKVTTLGKYGMMFVYGEDNTINPPIPGMRPGEEVSFSINDIPAVPTPEFFWQNDRDVHNVNLVSQGLTADFVAEPVSGISPLTVTFTDKSQGLILERLWDFGDGNTSVEINPSHTYDTSGSYTVSLTVNSETASDVEVKANYINVYSPVAAEFLANKTEGVAPLSVSFENLSTGDYTSSMWDFGDSNTSEQLNPSHTYMNGGLYTVSLLVEGPGGSDSEIKTNYVHVFNKVYASFITDINEGTWPLTVSFTNTSIGDYTNLHWDFGDGTTSNSINPVHTYQSKGTFLVTLSATGPGGEDLFSAPIKVYDTVSSDFLGSPRQGLVPLTVYFQNQSTGDFDAYLWDFGDGETSTQKNPNHVYTVGGSYDVTLTVSGLGGVDTQKKESYITAFDPSQALFSAMPTSGSSPLLVSFANLSLGSFTSQTWDFGDGATSTEFEPIHTYSEAGAYTVTLSIDGPGGYATETKINYINVFGEVAADFTGTPLSGVGPLEVTFTNESTGSYDTYAWDFGDGGTSTVENPTYTYTEAGTYTVKLTVSGLGGTDTKTKASYITVGTPVAADFTGTPLSGVAPLEVSFTNESTGSYDTYAWDFGDGGTSTVENPTHTYTEAGTYTVKLTVSGVGGTNTKTKTDYITVHAPVTADFTGTPLSGVAPLEVTFTNESTGSYDTYAWDFGDGGTSTVENPTYTYTEAGTYTVKLTVSGVGGTNTKTKTNYITVHAPVTADFTGTPLSGVAPLEVSFTNESTGSYDTYAWDFGDGGASTVENPTYTYTEAGTYTVKLTVSGLGGTDTKTKASYITVGTPVAADFTGTPLSGVAPLEVSFTNESTGSYDTYAWDFGDGGTSTVENPTHTYTESGTYTVKLTVSGVGGTNTKTKTNYITVHAPVTADFTGTPLSGVAPLEVSFTNESTGSYDTYAWDFGDGGTSAVENPTYTYTAAGTYTVKLTVSGVGGTDTKTKTGYITVGTSVAAEFTGTPLSGVAPLGVSFTNESTGSYDTYAWDFGDGGTSAVENPTHTYTAAGTYTVKLTVSGLGGTDTKTKTDYITVLAPVTADFTGTPLSGVAPLEVSFTNESTGSYDTYAWDFGDGGTSTVENPTHTYTESGTYTVKLTVSGLGGTDTKTKTGYITVGTPVVADFTGTPLSGVAPLEVSFTNESTGSYDTYAWDFGDGGTSAIENPSHTYTEAGTYTVKLTVSGVGGTNTKTKTNYITVHAPVTADFTGTPLSGVAPLEVSFTNESTGSYDTYAWDFGDGGTSTVENPTYTYTEAGTYTVKLTVSGLGGTDTKTKTGYITVGTPVMANFTGTPLSGVTPLEVSFTNESTGSYDTYAWDFGDGGTSAIENPTHTYTEAGTYTVKLTVSGVGGTDTKTKTDYITVHAPVTADFIGIPLSGVAPLEVSFTNESTGSYDTYAWDFGDGGTSAIENPTHTYAEAGTYTVKLTVSGVGGTDTKTKTGYITVGTPVVADFTGTPLSGVTPLEVSFTNESTGSYDTYAWDFGDGGTSAVENPTHTYTAAGTYTVKLTVSGVGGIDTKTKTNYITVYAPVNAFFTATPSEGHPVLVVSFTNCSTGSFDTVMWDFGDGNVSQENNPIHSFIKPGTYQVVLKVEGLGGQDTYQSSVIVKPYTMYIPLIFSR